MTNFNKGQITGAITGIIGTWLAIFFFSVLPEYSEKKNACEKPLPRDQKCVMVMVPKLEQDQ